MADTLRKRAACDECRLRKIKCSRESSCSRCREENIACVYSTQKIMGRPRKRKHDDQSSSALPVLEQHISSPAEPNLPDSAVFTADASIIDQLATPDLDLTGFDTTDGADFLATTSTQSLLRNQPCACLSAIYLMLDNLRSMEDFSFPSSLRLLREALSTASDVIQCSYCPTQFLTATQNVHLLGTLLLTMAERYNKILQEIEAEEQHLIDSGQMKMLQLAPDTESPNTLNGEFPRAPVSFPRIELKPSEWRSLAKRAVKAEVHGTSDVHRTSLMSVMSNLEYRQGQWHKLEPTADCPNPESRRWSNHNDEDKPVCLTLVRTAKELVMLFNFD